MKILTINPGGNSVKAQLIECELRQQHAFQGKKLFNITIEDIGKDPSLFGAIGLSTGSVTVEREGVEAAGYTDAVLRFFDWYQRSADKLPSLGSIDSVAVRVVHGGDRFRKPMLFTDEVAREVENLEKLAPLHNKSSLEVMSPLRTAFPTQPIFAVFDSAFHRSIPEHAYRYGIPLELADKHGIRRYGFHGISHRYQLERYAWLNNKSASACNIVTTHLESGCSVTAIREGKSIDNTMGLTPLEGLMMGTRSGDIDPTVIDLLMREEKMEIDAVMTLLNKKSGLLGVSEKSLDTRVLMKDYDSDRRARLAMDLFAYRLRKAIGAMAAAIGDAEAVIFSGGIGEDTPMVRAAACKGLSGFGLKFDPEANSARINEEGRITAGESRLHAWVIVAEEGLEMAHESLQELRPSSPSLQE
jgi:acetate kinase